MEHLSLLAHLASLSLGHPPITMFTQSAGQLLKLRPFLPLRSSLPCDVHLLNLRTLEDPQVSAETLPVVRQEVVILLLVTGQTWKTPLRPPSFRTGSYDS